MLEDLGHKGAASGALNVLATQTPIDLMTTNYSMPSMDGAQLAKAAGDVRPNLPILLATGYAELPEGSELELHRVGKPYTQSKIDIEINNIR